MTMSFLKACLKQALKLWPDRKGASDRCLRDMLRTYRHTRRVSNFRPTVAKAIYERYSKDGDRILDFCAGYGGRLLGCLPLQREYIGLDPCQLQVDGLKNAYKTIEALDLTKTKVEIRRKCAEVEMRTEQTSSYDLIFTSPPYFNCEQYSTESSQSYIMYPTYKEWQEKFLSVVISESYRLLKPNGFFILNVADVKDAPIATDAKKLANEFFSLCKTYYLRISTLPFHKKSTASHYRHEPIFVFQK